MFLFETILFYNKIPSFYNIHLVEEKYYCEAAPNPYYSNVPFPNFFVTEKNGRWEAEGTHDVELLEQVARDIKRHLLVAQH